jgi:hypothetical protein
MELKLGSVVSSLSLLTAWAYSLGWIKSLYYYSAVGIGLEQLELAPQDYLFASWYTVENTMFFLLLLWIAALSGKLWPWIFVLVYLPIPWFTDWSYQHLSNPICRYFVENPHSILKFFPFALLLLIAAIDKHSIPLLRASTWNQGNFGLALLLVVAVAWSISAAKHIGTSDAKRVLHNPKAYLMHVNLHFTDAAADLKSIESRPSLYMFSFSEKHCIVLELSDYQNVSSQPSQNVVGQHVHLFAIPRDSLRFVDGTFEVPGAGELINKHL